MMYSSSSKWWLFLDCSERESGGVWIPLDLKSFLSIRKDMAVKGSGERRQKKREKEKRKGGRQGEKR